MGLHSAALTNTPAIDAMETIANSNKPGLEGAPSEEPGDGSDGTLAALAELLRLDTSATLEDIYKAVSALLEGRDTMQMKADAYQFEIVRMKADSGASSNTTSSDITTWTGSSKRNMFCCTSGSSDRSCEKCPAGREQN